MTPKEKAKYLINDFYDIKAESLDYGMEWQMTQQCALITVDEIIRESKLHDKTTYQHGRTSYWQEVRNEIEKL